MDQTLQKIPVLDHFVILWLTEHLHEISLFVKRYVTVILKLTIFNVIQLYFI